MVEEVSDEDLELLVESPRSGVLEEMRTVKVQSKVLSSEGKAVRGARDRRNARGGGTYG
jgi:hypothetical protein